jgi:tetratricopeptide (TPR) repeat protein
MHWLKQYLKPTLGAASLAIAILGAQPVFAQDTDALLQGLASATADTAPGLADRIRREWDKSGSAAADLLLLRARKALKQRDFGAAIDHYTALTDHAPNFAEGWHGRANAYFAADLLGPAVADLERALLLNPNHFDAIRGLAVVFETLNRPQDAYAAYLLVKSIHPHHPDITEAIERLETLATGQKL